MPSLTTKQTNHFKTVLQDRREALRDEIHDELMQGEQEGYAELAGQVRDLGENSIADFFSEMNINLIQRQLGEMQEIESALLRISNGSFGICEHCGVDIEPARLEANPIARRCTVCQSHHEATYSGTSTPSI
jgi:DnaK suppressor protein